MGPVLWWFPVWAMGWTAWRRKSHLPIRVQEPGDGEAVRTPVEGRWIDAILPVRRWKSRVAFKHPRVCRLRGTECAWHPNDSSTLTHASASFQSDEGEC